MMQVPYTTAKPGSQGRPQVLHVLTEAHKWQTLPAGWTDDFYILELFRYPATQHRFL